METKDQTAWIPEPFDVNDALGKIGRLALEGEPIPSGELTAEDFTTLYTIAHSLYESCEYKQAQTIFHRLVLAKPLQSEYWFGMGSCLQQEQSYSEALSAWAMCALLDGYNPIPHFHAAECYLSLNNADEARKALALFLQIAGEEPQYELERKRAHLLLKQWQEE